MFTFSLFYKPIYICIEIINSINSTNKKINGRKTFERERKFRTYHSHD